MAGIDLHSNNVMIGIVDQEGRRLKHQKLDCDLTQVDGFLRPFKRPLKSIAVESTYNWYWLVDGLRALSYPVELANPAQIEQYSGIKHADDKNDAFFLAELQRLDILPTGYIYDPALRPVRDLLRRRLSLVHQRSALMISFKSLYTRTTGRAQTLVGSMPTGDSVTCPAQVLRQVLLHLHCRFIRHWVQMREQLRQQSNTIPFDNRRCPESGFVILKSFFWFQAGHPHINTRFLWVAVRIYGADFSESGHGGIEQHDIHVVVLFQRFVGAKFSVSPSLHSWILPSVN